MLNKVIERYNNLPKVSFGNKIKFALWKGLFKNLIAEKVVDSAGCLAIPRFAKPERPTPRSTYKTLVCVNGFYASGSSAVADLLQEYQNVTTSLSGRLEDSVEERNKGRCEFDIVRGGCGVFALEHLFETRNMFERDTILRVFMSFVETNYNNCIGNFYDDKFIAITRKFLNRLISMKTRSPDGFPYAKQVRALGTHAANFVLGHPKEDKCEYVYYLKDLSIAEYRAIAREYIEEAMRTVESKDYLVLDQGCADCSSDFDRFQDYFGPLKAIWCYRDPRDVYAICMKHKYEGCVPEDAETFIEWYKTRLAPFWGKTDDRYLMFQFEDLIMDYDATVAKIEAYLGLSASDHIAPRKYFKPAESFVRSIGIWRNEPNQEAVRKIRQALPEFCYRDDCVCPQ